MTKSKTLRSKIKILKASLTKIDNFVNSVGVKEVTELEAKFKQVESLLPKYEELFDQLLDTREDADDADESDGLEEEYVVFQERLYYIKQKLMDQIREFNVNEVEVKPVEVVNNQNLGIRTPAINIQKFNGKVDDWTRFYESYKTIIHDNPQTGSDIQKFYYLISLLEGEAAEVINGIEISQDNYSFAWKKLVDHYKNNKILIETHIANMFAVKRLENQSAKGLKDLHNIFVKNVNSLKKLNVQNLEDNVFLVHLLTSKFDNLTLKAWEEATKQSREMPSYRELEEFVVEHCNYLEAYERKCTGSEVKGVRRNSVTLVTETTNKCPLCKKSHTIFRCNTFLRLSVDSRRNEINRLKLCWQCLASGHRAGACRGRPCWRCGGKHNQLVCRTPQAPAEGGENKQSPSPGQGPSSPPGAQLTSRSPPATSSACLASSAGDARPSVIFPTCQARLRAADGALVLARFLLDSASELNFISQDLANKLGFNAKKDEINVFGISNLSVTSRGYISTRIKSRLTKYCVDVDCHILPNIPQPNSMNKLPSAIPEFDVHKKYMADPDFDNFDNKTDGILGAGIFFDSLKKSNYLWSPNVDSNYLIKTAFGWVVCGEMSPNGTSNSGNCFVSITQPIIISETDQGVTSSRRKAMEEAACEQHFTESVIVHSDGHYCVSLPFKMDPSVLGNSVIGAERRFLNLEKRLAQNPEIKTKYTAFMNEYIELGHMEVIPEEDIQKWPNYYLPHHCILKDSATTGLRVVFDASFKTSSGLSLNDILLPGPSLQSDVFDLLTAFRFPKFGIMADIGKMYRQIWVNEKELDFQRILWRAKPDNPLLHFRLKTVTYGTRSAPYLAIRCLRHLASDVKKTDPVISEIITKKFFMDDYVDGSDTLDNLIEKQQKIESILRGRGFQLRKWCSNSEILMNMLKNDMDQHYCLDLADGDNIKTLGLTWNPRTDELVARFHDFKETKISKRAILADLHSFWDPIGLLVPIFIRGRMFLQELWQCGLSWDQELPEKLSDKWLAFRKQLHLVNGLGVPRRVGEGDIMTLELHGFSDASEKAYGACIYARSRDLEGKISSHLVCARARVAPLQKQSLPRMELQAAVLLTDMMEQLISALDRPIADVHYWSDSTVALCWIHGIPQQWKTYVANRVSRIQEVSSASQWHHVTSADNPADIISRGMPPGQLKGSQLWWKGPSWLIEDTDVWPVWKSDNSGMTLERKKTAFTLVCSTIGFLDIILRFSSWRKTYRVTSWCRRFIYNCRKNKEQRITGHLTTEELKEAKLLLIRAEQRKSFPEEIERLESGRQIPKRSRLLPLSVFLGETNVLRVGGRLSNSDIPDKRKHPIILPYKSKLTELILRDFHVRFHHPGPSALLTIVRGEFWPLSGKSAVKSIVHACMTCRRASPKPLQPRMADLPSDRVSPGRPFDVCGVDYCGPIYLKQGGRRSVKRKAYIAVFVCFATKAINLELVTDLSSQAFIAALRRFFARRGMSRRIYSDNGTNFVGAQKELRPFIQDGGKLRTTCADLGVEWLFIPPGAPHFGGLWEASVKLVKRHLRRTMGSMIMTYEEAMTLLLSIEACLNSRPLTPISDSPDDLEPLTPSHFLIGGPMHLPPESDLLCRKPLTRRWDRVKQFYQALWRRWSTEYLSSLQLRNKWRLPGGSIPVGALVAVKDENLRPTEWRMARVEKLHPGKDGVPRVATIHLGSGKMAKRPLVKLCPLLEEIPT